MVVKPITATAAAASAMLPVDRQREICVFECTIRSPFKGLSLVQVQRANGDNHPVTFRSSRAFARARLSKNASGPELLSLRCAFTHPNSTVGVTDAH